MALKGLRVIEMAGLAPSPFAGMIFADNGAEVIRVDPLKPIISSKILSRGKKSIAVNIKKADGVDIVRKLASQADILIEPFRPGVMERLGLGPEILIEENQSLIFARLSGYGQTGSMAQASGHDINYLAMNGVLSKLGRSSEAPFPPINLLADFAGGSALCVVGIMMALFSRTSSGKGQVVDASLSDGAAYISSFLFSSINQMPIMWPAGRGSNVLDSGCPYYNTYKTKDGKFMAVGALEPQFYSLLLEGLDITETEYPDLPNQIDFPRWSELFKIFSDKFKSKTQEEWIQIFSSRDACVSPVLSFAEAAAHPHNVERKMFLEVPDGIPEPAPSPKLSDTPASPENLRIPKVGEHTREILESLGYDDASIQRLIGSKVIKMPG